MSKSGPFPGSGLLVTGGTGQVGRAFRSLAPRAAVLGRDRLDVTDRSRVFEVLAEHSPQIVVNAAAYTAVDAAERDPAAARRVNVEGARNVAEAAESFGALLVQISTDYVYRGDKSGPYAETDPAGPLSVYGRTKLEGEAAASACSRLLIVRTSWVFGEGRNFIRSILKAAGEGAKELTVVGDQLGLPTYAPDLAVGILRLAGRQAGGIFHLAGSGSPGTWADVAEAALGAAGLPAEIRRVTTEQYAAARPGPLAPRPANSVLDCSRASGLGVVLPPWRESVAGYVRSMARNPVSEVPQGPGSRPGPPGNLRSRC